MYDERDKNINSQTNSSTKYISNTYRGVMQNEIYCNWIIINIYLEYLIDKKVVRWIITIIHLVLILLLISLCGSTNW